MILCIIADASINAMSIIINMVLLMKLANNRIIHVRVVFSMMHGRLICIAMYVCCLPANLSHHSSISEDARLLGFLKFSLPGEYMYVIIGCMHDLTQVVSIDSCMVNR